MALHELGDTNDLATFQSNEEWLLASIAVSLKRIADAMQEPNAYGEVGGAAISGAILRGLRDGQGGR